jgi:predicted nuclease of predicted toxin-antitoxin system
MKVLLDENLAHRLRNNLGEHEVFTVGYRGWAGLKNGELLRIAEENGIEVFLTGDRTLLHEQNLKGRNLGIVALSSVEWEILKNCLPAIVSAIENALPGSFQEVDCGTFSRKKTAGE